MKLKLSFLLLMFMFPCILSQSREEVRIATYNLLNYPDSYSFRNSDFQKVINEINPDILVVQEITSLFGVYIFLTEVLDSSKFVAGPFINGPDTDNAIFYKDSLITLISHITIPTALRDISEFTLYHNFTSDTLKIYSLHLKANQEDSTLRKAEVNILRIATNALPSGTNFLVLGDFNIYHSNESAYLNLLNQTNSGYLLDPIDSPGSWHNNNTYASLHTQSTMTSSHWGGSTGGLDDRFDMILISQTVKDTGGIVYIENSYKAFGNDGQHFNLAINDPPFNIITQEIANALNNSSDHLPVFADFDFGTVSHVDDLEPIITTFTLYQNYPNPFNPATKISFELPHSTNVKLLLYDLLGREVKSIYEGEALSGMNEVELNAGDLTSGIYFYTLISKEFISTKKLTILK